MADLERIYTIPLRSAYEAVRGKRSRKAVKIVRSFISRHMKAEIGEVSISEGVNSLIWKRGIQKPPRKIKVRAVKSGEGVSVLLIDEKVGEAKVEKAPKKKEAGAPKGEVKKGDGGGKEEPPKKEEAPKKEEPKPAKEGKEGDQPSGEGEAAKPEMKKGEAAPKKE
jgi:large subunit ribosomal protein L31e